MARKGGRNPFAEGAEPGIFGNEQEAAAHLQEGDWGPRVERDGITVAFGKVICPFSLRRAVVKYSTEMDVSSGVGIAALLVDGGCSSWWREILPEETRHHKGTQGGG
jgi:hypothetical protein